MSAPEIILSAAVAALVGSLLVDIFSFVSHALPNFLRHAKITESPQNPDFAVIVAALKDMQSLGLIVDGPFENERPAITRILHPEDRESTTTKRAA